MKRELVHSTPECEPSWVTWTRTEQDGTTQRYTSFANPYPGEHVKMVRGKALYGKICDSCGKPIPAGSLCSAVSMWADYGGIPYYSWENEYMEK